MKIYTNTVDIAQPVLKRFWVAPHSDFKLGVKIVNNGAEVESEFTVKAGGAALTADEDKVDGFTVYTLSSSGTGFVEYTVEVDGVAEKQKIVQIVTDSTVFEVGGTGGGGDLSEYAKKTWVEAEISGFVTEDDLSGKVTNLSSVSGIMKISQADYDVLSAGGTADANTLYVIV